MHSFTDLIDRSTSFTLARLSELQDNVHEALKTSGATSLVNSLQMIRLQKVVMAVGMFSIFESMIQDRLDCKDGFKEAGQILDAEKKIELKGQFSKFTAAINVLKHGRGRSYEALLTDFNALPFRVKRPDKGSFFEGDVSEISTLIEVDDAFVLGCAETIRDVSSVIRRLHPGCGL